MANYPTTDDVYSESFGRQPAKLVFGYPSYYLYKVVQPAYRTAGSLVFTANRAAEPALRAMTPLPVDGFHC